MRAPTEVRPKELRKRHGLPDRPSQQRNGPSLPAPAREVSGPLGGRTQGCTLDSAARVKPGHAASAARPWPSVETPTVHTDRRNCAHRPSLRPGRPSAMRPWTAQHDGPQRNKLAHNWPTENAPPAREFAASGAFSQVVAGVGFEPT